MNIYYVYQHRRTDTGEIFYVGKGKQSRCFTTSNRNQHWVNITNKTPYTIEVLYDNLTEDVAKLVEIGLITLYKSQGLNLCNITIGGDGSSGLKHTLEARQVMSNKKRGRKLTDEHKSKIGQGNKGKVITEEQRKKISDSLKGKKLSEAHKKAIREGMNKRVTSSE
jgi:hypothetical protein